MVKKLIKLFFVSGTVLVFVGFSGWLLVKYVITLRAAEKAETIIEQAYEKHSPQNDDEKIIAIATQIFENFEHAEPSEILSLRLRAYLTNRRLPEFLRLDTGVIETHIEKGQCDNFARMLSFLLVQEGFESILWNMVIDKLGHSALLVTMPDGRQVFADPYYGYVAADKNRKLLHPKDAQNKIRQGAIFSDVFLPLGENSDPVLYSDFSDVRMAAQGDDLVIESTLPRLDNQPLVLGDLDKSSKDVKSAAKRLGMTPYWFYMGHRLNREWVRVLKAREPVKIVMTLVENAEEGVLTSDKKPVVEGKNLTWQLQAGDKIVFRDGLAKISFKRLNSFIDVDQITLFPVAQ